MSRIHRPGKSLRLIERQAAEVLQTASVRFQAPDVDIRLDAPSRTGQPLSILRSTMDPLVLNPAELVIRLGSLDCLATSRVDLDLPEITGSN